MTYKKTIVNTWTCDQCGFQSHDSSNFISFTTDRYGDALIRAHGSLVRVGKKHFCSFDCLEKYAKDKLPSAKEEV